MDKEEINNLTEEEIEKIKGAFDLLILEEEENLIQKNLKQIWNRLECMKKKL